MLHIYIDTITRTGGNKASVSAPAVFQLRANLLGDLESTAKVVVVRSADNILWQKSPTITLTAPGDSLNIVQKYDETLAGCNEVQPIGTLSFQP